MTKPVWTCGRPTKSGSCKNRVREGAKGCHLHRSKRMSPAEAVEFALRVTRRFVEVVTTGRSLVAVSIALAPHLESLRGQIWPEYFWDEVANADLDGVRREALAAEANQPRLEEKYRYLPADLQIAAQDLFFETLALLDSQVPRENRRG